MSGADGTYDNLISFGVDTVLAREASKRYAGNVEAAADWCFGAGSNVSLPPALTSDHGADTRSGSLTRSLNLQNMVSKVAGNLNTMRWLRI